jgi:hypothetical protein
MVCHDMGMATGPTVGWNPTPERPNSFRYWNGREWTGAATRSERGFTANVSLTGRRRIWHRVSRNAVIFHTAAWFNCSVPGVRGRLDRLAQPREFRELHAIDKG